MTASLEHPLTAAPAPTPPAAELTPPAAPSDREDAVAAARGDRDAWTRLYNRLGPVVHGVLLSRGLCIADADDLTQEVFIRAMSRIAGLQESEKFGAWLCAIARNEALAHQRKMWRRGLRLVGLAAQKPQVLTPPRAPTGIDTEEAMAAIRDLPEAYRETLVLRLVEGLTGPQIAASTGLTEGSVRVNLSRGMKMLRDRLGAAAMETGS